MKISKNKKIINKALSAMTALILALTTFFSLPIYNGFNAFAIENETMTAMRIYEWQYDAGVGHSVTVETGKTYKFTMLWKFIEGIDSYFSLSGGAVGNVEKKLVITTEAQDGVEYDRLTGRVSYVFTAEGSDLNLYAQQGSGKDVRKDLYFAQPELYEVDSDGNKISGTDIDCDPEFQYSWLHCGYGGDYRHVVTVSSDFFNLPPSKTFDKLELNEAPSVKFYHDIFNYNVKVDYTVDKFDIAYTLVNGAELVSITGNENFESGSQNDVIITIRNTEDTLVTYTIHVTKLPDPSESITAMHIYEWQYDAGLNHPLKLETGKTYKYTMLWKFVEGVDSFFALSGDAVGGERKLIIRNEPQEGVEFDRETGRLSYIFTAEAEDVLLYIQQGSGENMELKDIYFALPEIYQVDENGEKIPGTELDCDPEFDDSWEKWPYGGDYRHVELVPEDFFNLPPSKTFAELKLLNAESIEFYHDVYTYDITVDHTVDSLDIEYDLVSGASLKSITGNENFEEGGKYDVVITFIDTDGNDVSYTLHVTKQYDPSKSVITMRIHEWQYDAGLNHTVKVEKGKTYKFSILWKFVLGVDSYLALTGSAVGGTEKKLAIKDAPQPGASYDPTTGEISYVFTAEDEDLTILVQEGSGVNIEKDMYFAKPEVYQIDDEGNKIPGTDLDCDPEFDDSWEHWGYGGNYRNVEVKNADFFDRKDFPAGLTSLDVGYTLTPNFDYRYYWYDITVPYNVESLDIDYTPAEDVTFKSIEGNEGFEDGKIKDVVITVADKEGTEVKYTVRVMREVEPDAALTDLDVGYEFTPEFNSEVLQYTMSVPNDVTSLDVNTKFTENSTLVSVTGNTDLKVGIPTDVVITLANTKGKETKYIITVTRLGAGGDTGALEDALKDAAAQLKPDNSITEDIFASELQKAIGNGYTVSVTDFYKLTAVAGAEDNYGTIVPASDGYINAIVSITDGNKLANLPVTVKIKAPVVKYSFTEDEVSVEEDFELDDDGKYLVGYYGNAKKIIIPDTVEEIGFNWYQADDLSTAQVLVIPDNVKYLPTNLCYGMRHLETVYMGDGTTELPSRAFDRCIFLQNVKLSNNLKKIGDHAFAANTTLESIRLPYGLEEIEQGAFYYSFIRDITVPATVNKIGDEAFGVPFNAPLQMVNGSDNIYFCFMFETEQDEDLLKIIDYCNEKLDYWDRTGAVYDTYEEAPIGTAWGEDDPWPNGPVYVTPRIVTILNKDVEIGKTIGYTRNAFYEGGVTIRMPDGGNAAEIIREDIKTLERQYEDKVAQEGPDLVSIVGLEFEPLNMTAPEIASRAQFAADNLVISENTLEDTIAAIVKKSYYSALDTSLEWSEKISLSNGYANGAFKLKAGEYIYDIAFNVPIIGEVSIGDDVTDEEEDLDFGIDTSIIPIKVKPGSKVVLMDWNSGVMTVLKYTTISTFLDNITVEDGYDLVFYDDEGYEIYDVFYDTAYFEDNFIMMVKEGYNRINEFYFTTVEGSLPTTGDNTNIAITVILCAVSAIFLFGSAVKVKKAK